MTTCQLIRPQMVTTAAADPIRIARSARLSRPESWAAAGCRDCVRGVGRAGARVACSGPNVKVREVTSGAAGHEPVDLHSLRPRDDLDGDDARAVGEPGERDQLRLAGGRALGFSRAD